MFYKNICYDFEGRIVFVECRFLLVDCFCFFGGFNLTRESKARPVSRWWYLALGRSSWRRSQLPWKNTQKRQDYFGTCDRAYTARQRRVMQGCSTRHLGFVGQFNTLKFPKHIWLTWLLWLHKFLWLHLLSFLFWLTLFQQFHWFPWFMCYLASVASLTHLASLTPLASLAPLASYTSLAHCLCFVSSCKSYRDRDNRAC